MKLATHLHVVPTLKDAWSCTFTPPYVFMALCLITGYVLIAWYLVKHKENFTFMIGHWTQHTFLIDVTVVHCHMKDMI